jgi:hypothetical protein
VATDLWDNLPADTKKTFKLVDAGNKNISLQNKNATAH